MPIVRIDDPADERLADYRNVPDPVLLERSGVFVAEGRLVVRRLMAGVRLATRSIMVTGPALASIEDVLEGTEVPVFVVPQETMNAVAGFNIHRGCLAIGERPAPLDWRRLAADARRLVVLEGVGNVDNVGSVFRNAAAFGVAAVLLGPRCGDPLYRKAIRTSMAATLHVPFARIDPWPDALRELASDDTAAAKGATAVIGLTPGADAAPLAETMANVPSDRIVIVAGSEGEGLTEHALAACTHLARIPMAKGVDSINVATAVAIALYESGRRGNSESS